MVIHDKSNYTSETTSLNICSFKYFLKTAFPRDLFLLEFRLKRLPGMRNTRVQSLGWEDPLEKEMATHSSILA